MVSTRSKTRTSTSPIDSQTASWTRVLVTGANAGLGLDTCKRLISEFLSSRPESQSLHLIISTRSTSKSQATISTLTTHAARLFPTLKPNDSSSRLRLSSIELDLTNLPSVIRAARALRDELAQEPDGARSLHALIANAGISGWTGLDWWYAIFSVIRHPVQAVTWPPYTLHAYGLKTKPQLPANSGIPEPPLGEVFCANVFGHYLLAHELGPCLAQAGAQGKSAGPGRIIWLSSIEGNGEDFSFENMQCLDGGKAYNSSKRLTDILALTAGLKSNAKQRARFYRDPETEKSLNPQPRMYTCHPGVVSTDILPLHPVVAYAKRLSFYIARGLGSPWHTITGHKAAVAPVWLVLSPESTLDGVEERDGAGKWGSATDWRGNERVKRTEVDGWGFGGRVESTAPPGEHRVGRRAGAVDLTEEEREKFEELGVRCWAEMEKLRDEWTALMIKSGAI